MTSKPTCEELEQRIHALEQELAVYKNRNGSNQLNQQYLEAILNNTNLPIYLKDANYKYILINQQYEHLAHITCDQIRGKDDFAIFPEPVAQLFRSQDKEVIKRRKLVEFEETIPLPDGVHTFLTAKFPLIDDKGITYAVGGVCTDITHQKKIEGELKKAEEKYRSIFEHSPLGIFHMDKEGIFTASNEKLAKILGSSTKKLVGFDALESLKDNKMKKAFTSVLSGELSHYEGNYQSVTGLKKAYVRGIFSPIISSDGSLDSAMGILEDITMRKETEEALKRVHDELEQRVIDRTAELERKTEKLMETNIALKVLLEKRNEDKIEFEKKMFFNVEKLIFPYMEKLRMQCNDVSQKAILDIIQSNLDEIISSCATNNKEFYTKLTPAQIQVADLIKQGHTTKEIASLLNLSPSTISCHRQEIRKRLSLANKKVHLQATLAANS